MDQSKKNPSLNCVK